MSNKNSLEALTHHLSVIEKQHAEFLGMAAKIQQNIEQTKREIDLAKSRQRVLGVIPEDGQWYWVPTSPLYTDISTMPILRDTIQWHEARNEDWPVFTTQTEAVNYTKALQILFQLKRHRLVVAPEDQTYQYTIKATGTGETITTCQLYRLGCKMWSLGPVFASEEDAATVINEIGSHKLLFAFRVFHGLGVDKPTILL